MPGSTQNPDVLRQIASLRNQIRELQRRTTEEIRLALAGLQDVNVRIPPNDNDLLTWIDSDGRWESRPPPVGASPVFSYPGVLAPADSPPWYANQTLSFANVRLSVATAGSGTDIEVFLNGSSLGTVSLGGSALTTTTGMAISMSFGDFLTVSLTTGGGAEGASVEFW